MENNRKFAMSWWNRLSSNTKTKLCDRHKEHFEYGINRWEMLLPEDIQTIYQNEKPQIYGYERSKTD